MFAHRLEQTIRKEPAYWLWSHKRWKLNREEAGQQEQEILNKKKEVTMKVSVVILNWNGCDMLRTFLPSVVRYSEGEGNRGLCG